MAMSNKQHLTVGFTLTAGFLIVLWIMFQPYFGGVNAFTASDNLFNSMAKGSTDYFPELSAQADSMAGTAFDFELEFKDGQFEGHEGYEVVGAKVASDVAVVLGKYCTASATGNVVKVSGDISDVSAAAIADAKAMFNNDGAGVSAKYGMPEKMVMFVWWKALSALQNEFKLAKNAKAMDFVKKVVQKGVEVGYNFYGIQPEKVSTKMGLLTFALVFYVIYTLWWGVAILNIFEGIGLKMTKGAKKEV